MAVISRSVVRKEFATLLQSSIVGSGKPVQRSYAYQVGDFGGASPVVVVTSGPIMRKANSFGDCSQATITLYVWVLVLYADPESSWTESDAEDAIDSIEALIADVVFANRSNPHWSDLKQATSTQLDDVIVGGKSYCRELIQIEAEIIT